MRLLHYKSFSVSGFLAYLLLTLGAASLHAQTFRGGINGTVTDQSGAAVPGAIVETVNDGTGVSYKAISSSGGEFVFQDLPLATYTVNVTASGFETEKIQGVPVSAGVIYTLPVRMRVASAGETVEVSASALALDTTSTVQTTDIPSRAVQDTPMNGRDFTQLIALMPGYAGYSGGGYGSVNGARPDMTNWQIEGADNNDVWWNVPAANQGGISGIAGVTLPLDAIDEFSVVTQGSAESGRNPGAVVNMVIKSGTNQLHGSAYYYNRNEALAAQSALSPTKPELRNQQFGFSAGGPIWRDKFFWFVTYEEQKFIIGVNQPSTEPSAAYQTLAMQQLTAYGVPVNQTALNLLHGTGSYAALWPAAALTGPATPYNYTNPANETGLRDQPKQQALLQMVCGPRPADSTYDLAIDSLLRSRADARAKLLAGIKYHPLLSNGQPGLCRGQLFQSVVLRSRYELQPARVGFEYRRDESFSRRCSAHSNCQSKLQQRSGRLCFRF
jgi:hypothetical protein